MFRLVRATVYFGLMLLMVISTSQNVTASEDLSVWTGGIKCVGPNPKSRSVEFTTDGKKAWLRGFTNYNESYESKLKKNKAKFSGVYKGFYKGGTFRKHFAVKVKILKNGDVKVSGLRARETCSGVLKAAVVKDPEVIAKENAEKLVQKIKHLLGDWKGKGGALGRPKQGVVASFKRSGDQIVGDILFDPCLPKTELTISQDDNVLEIFGGGATKSFRAEISAASGSVTDTSIQIYYKLDSDVSGCPESELGFLSLKRQ